MIYDSIIPTTDIITVLVGRIVFVIVPTYSCTYSMFRAVRELEEKDWQGLW